MKSIILSLVILVSLYLTSYSQWVQTTGTPEGGGVTDMLITPNGTLIVTCASFNWPNGQSGGIRHSSNGGTTWENDYQHFTARTLALGQNGYVFASSWDYPNISEGLWVSFNQGATWVGHLYLIGSNNNIFSILVRDNNQTIYIGTRTGVRKSTNGGGSFTPVNNGIPANSWVRDIAADSSGTLAAATTNGLFISTNNSASWIQATGLQSGDTIVSLAFDHNFSSDSFGKTTRLLAGSDNGRMYQSFEEESYTTNVLAAIFSGEVNSVAITMISSENMKVHGVATFPIENQSTGFSLSTNNGTNWTQQNGGLPQLAALSALAFGAYNTGFMVIYLGTFGNTINGAKIYRWEMPIGIQQISNEVPNRFSLSQNYPNPFNPMTKIKFSVPKSSNVNITIFDVLGRHITTLVNEKLNTGTYETEWNAVNIPAGVYFYRMEAGDFSETKKIILVK